MTRRVAFFFAAFSILSTLALVSARTALAIPPVTGSGGAGGLKAGGAACATVPNAPAAGQAGSLVIDKLTVPVTITSSSPTNTAFQLTGAVPHLPRAAGSVTFNAVVGSCSVSWTYVGPTLSSSSPGVVTITHYESLGHTTSAAPSASANPGGPRVLVLSRV